MCVKKSTLTGIAIGVIFIAGCGNSNSSAGGHEGHVGHQSAATQEGSHKTPAMIKVDLHVPAEAKLNESTTLSARVTQDAKAVDDADKVEFELWLDGADHETIVGKVTKDGTYQIEKTFDKAGTYYVISHVTARDMHAMPKKEFTVK